MFSSERFVRFALLERFNHVLHLTLYLQLHVPIPISESEPAAQGFLRGSGNSACSARVNTSLARYACDKVADETVTAATAAVVVVGRAV